MAYDKYLPTVTYLCNRGLGIGIGEVGEGLRGVMGSFKLKTHRRVPAKAWQVYLTDIRGVFLPLGHQQRVSESLIGGRLDRVVAYYN